MERPFLQAGGVVELPGAFLWFGFPGLQVAEASVLQAFEVSNLTCITIISRGCREAVLEARRGEASPGKELA